MPSIGTVGFYRPDPGGPRSPNIVREVGDTGVVVLELASGETVNLERDDWMSASEMCAQTNAIVDSGRWQHDDLERRIRAMTAAFDSYPSALRMAVSSLGSVGDEGVASVSPGPSYSGLEAASISHRPADHSDHSDRGFPELQLSDVSQSSDWLRRA